MAVNSLAASDHVLVYEMARRMRCEEHQMAIMKKHGALDGSTPNSVKKAFSKFVFLPLITGNDFKEEGLSKVPLVKVKEDDDD